MSTLIPARVHRTAEATRRFPDLMERLVPALERRDPLADDAIRAFVEKSGAPFLPMSMGKGLLPDTHPQCAGAARSTVLKDSDVVMLIGARLNWLLSHGKGKTWGDAPKQFIQVDIEPKEMDSNVEIVAPVVGDIGSCVSALNEAMGAKWPSPPAELTGPRLENEITSLALSAPLLAMPQPSVPVWRTFSPAPTVRLSSCTAWWRGKRMLRPSTRRMGGMGGVLNANAAAD